MYQQVKTTKVLFVKLIRISGPVQFVEVNTQVFVLLHRFNVLTFNVHWCMKGGLVVELKG